jgi:Cu(I)/Ag(I) efflux system membrane protein CusA/SilA
MIDRIIRTCVANRLLVVVVSGIIAVCGIWASQRLPLDAIPDLSDVQVVIATEWSGRSPDLVEDQVTYPIVSSLVSTPRVRSVRGFTEFGLSYVYVIFDDNTDLYWARARVLEYLQAIRGRLPDGVNPTMGPDATAVGWVFQYAVVDTTGATSLDQLRSLQDWTIRYALAGIPGVSDVASIGGFVKQYQVSLDPARLNAYGLSPKQIIDAIRANNNDAEGRVIERAGREYVVRSKGALTSIADIEQVALDVDEKGSAVRIRDVAQVRLGPDIRRGAAELDGRGEAVGGIVIMRAGENALDVLDLVKSRLTEVKRTLPAGIDLVTTYDRSDLVRRSLGTLRSSLIEELLVVSLVIVAFLSHWRSALIPLVTLPLALAAAMLPLWYYQVTANIMSLGGIALAIGVLVDASIVIVENGYRRVAESRSVEDASERYVLLSAAHQVGRPVFFSLAVIIVSFLPVFLLEGEEGRLFTPLALTKTLIITAASILAVTLVPVLMLLLIRRDPDVEQRPNALTRFCARIYEPILRVALRQRRWALLLNAALIPLTMPLVLGLGHEFMPPLYEGSLLYMPSAPAGLSMTEATRLLQVQDRVLKEFPEVERVFGTIGRSTTATDNSNYGMVNTTLMMKPREQWRAGVTFEGLQAEMNEALQLPGFRNIWTQPIRSRLDMLSTGMKTPVGLKLLGSDVFALEELGRRVAAILVDVPGTRNVYAERFSESFYVDIRPDREVIGRYGLTVQDVEEVVRSAIGGSNIGEVVERRERYPINVRYERDFRDDLPALERVLVKTSQGAQVPLGQLAAITSGSGPAMIRDENGRLAAYVYIDTDDRDIGGYVQRARRILDEKLTLSPGYGLEWTGQYEQQQRASARLRLIVPLVLALVWVILFMTFNSASEAMVVMLSVVYAMTGGVVAQWLSGYPFSVAVWVGYIALFGVAVQTGVVMVVYLQEAIQQRQQSDQALTETGLYEAVVAGAVLRLRPKLMTVAATLGGLLPILWSTGIGSDILKPIAAPIVGGMVTSAVHVLIITPVIFFIMKKRRLENSLT